MNIILGSLNESKKRSIIYVLQKFDIDDFNIIMFDAKSNVSSKPINDDILLGAKNRNDSLYDIAINNNINFDLIISIEGGFEQVLDKYFIVTYAVILDNKGNEFVGKSYGLEITNKMFNYVKSGNSLNKVIENILDNSNNKKMNGITGYLTNNYFKRDYFESTAVLSAFLSMLNYNDNYKTLEKSLN